MEKYVLIGGGLTAGQTALTLLKNGVKDQITLVTNEQYYPYERPGLSKGYLRGEEQIASLYADDKTLKEANNFAILTETNATKIDTQNKTVSLDNGDQLEYTKLLLATGTSPRHLDLDDSKNKIYYFRNINDVNTIKDKIKTDNCQSAIVIGASFIGMEVAASLTQLGLKVTVLHRGNQVFDKLDSPALSDKFLNYYENKGVRFVLKDEAEIITETGITTKNGENIAGNIIIAGVGVSPNIKLAQQAGLDINDQNHGVVVNEHFLTSQPNIWAGGDIAYFPDLISGENRRLEHWDAANEQGQFIAKQMLGTDEKYKHVAYFFSDIFDLSFEFFGDSTLATKNVSIDHWTQEKASFGELYLNDESVLVAAFVMNLSDDSRDKITQAIENKTKIDAGFIDQIK